MQPHINSTRAQLKCTMQPHKKNSFVYANKRPHWWNRPHFRIQREKVRRGVSFGFLIASKLAELWIFKVWANQIVGKLAHNWVLSTLIGQNRENFASYSIFFKKSAPTPHNAAGTAPSAPCQLQNPLTLSAFPRASIGPDKRRRQNFFRGVFTARHLPRSSAQT